MSSFDDMSSFERDAFACGDSPKDRKKGGGSIVMQFVVLRTSGVLALVGHNSEAQKEAAKLLPCQPPHLGAEEAHGSAPAVPASDQGRKGICHYHCY